MKKNNILWAVLPMMAAALMTTACSNDDSVNESPAQQNAAKTIPYTVTVNGGASTRATVESDNKTLYFATGDKLYVSGTNIKGVLDIQTGDGSTTGPGTASATFSGDLTYSGSGSPASDLSLTATLVSAQQTVGTSAGCQVSVNDAGEVTVNYPTTVYCADVASAVQKFSNLTGTSTYSSKSFSLTQQTAFLNFVITFEDGTAASANLNTVVKNNGSTICGGTVVTQDDGGVIKAKFVLPVAKGTTLSSANVKMGSKAAISFGASQTLEGKVYNVTKTQAAAYTMAAAATSADKGKLICEDGHIHANGADDACTKARVAKIIYIGTTGHATYSHGLALALTDEASTMAWQAAIDACSAKNTSTPVTDATWLLASKDQWNYMLGTNGAGSYTALRDASNLDSDGYWSRSEYETNPDEFAWMFYFNSGSWGEYPKAFYNVRVRACLAF